MLQDRAQTAEAQLAETTSQLHSLRLKQRELEARNHLLEKLAALDAQQTKSEGFRYSSNAQGSIVTSRQVC